MRAAMSRRDSAMAVILYNDQHLVLTRLRTLYYVQGFERAGNWTSWKPM
jgi:hypothetical protein